jgi:cardiolipin synthase
VARTRRLTTRRRRLLGIDRSGPDPRETRRGEPLRPFTLPNLIGYVRLAGIPVFLWLSFESGDGRSFAAALVYFAVAAGDYVDGLAARVTGQYSRLGALLDPFVDRLTVLAGAAACWHFELLPRWALAVVVVREVVTLALAQAALSRGLEVQINWLGRIGVWLVMTAIAFALIADSIAIDAVLLVGLAFALLASFVYVRTALRRLRG